VPIAQKLTIFTKGKTLEYDSKDADWVIGDTWVEVRTSQNKTYLFPLHTIDLIVLTFPKEKEKKEGEKE